MKNLLSTSFKFKCSYPVEIRRMSIFQRNSGINLPLNSIGIGIKFLFCCNSLFKDDSIVILLSYKDNLYEISDLRSSIFVTHSLIFVAAVLKSLSALNSVSLSLYR